MKSKERKDSNLMIAMIALDSDNLPSFDEILKQYEPVDEEYETISDVNEDGNKIIFNVAEGFGAIALMPAPIPWSDLEGPCATAWHWPEATEKMKDHKSHLIISLGGTNLDKIDNALLLTKIVSAIANCADTAGIYWGAGTIVHSLETFKNMTDGMCREYLPLYVWIDFRIIPEKKDTFTLFTTGFKLFDIMEVEIVKSKHPADILIEKAFNIGHYILDNGPVIKDGDTIGFNANEKIKVLHRNSLWDKTKKVYQLKL